MKLWNRRKIVAAFLLVAVACGGYYSTSQYHSEDYELLVKVARDSNRAPELSSDVVVVGIDLKSYKENSQWPWPRSDHAKILNKLNSFGVERVFFDIFFLKGSLPKEDAILAKSIAESRAQVFLPAMFVENESNGFDRVGSEPMFLTHASEVSINVWYNSIGQVTEIPYRFEGGGHNLQAMSAVIAGVDGKPFEMFPVDYAFDWNQIPMVSAVDILEGRVEGSKLAGKTVVYGIYTKEFGDTYIEPGGKQIPGLATQVLGANLLMQGRPIVVEKWIPIVIALIISVLMVFFFRSSWGIAGSLVMIPATFYFSVMLDSQFIYVENLPAFLIFLFAAAYHRASMYIDRLDIGRRTNRDSGMENRDALAEDLRDANRYAIVATKVSDYDLLLNSLSSEDLSSLLSALRRRLSLVCTKTYQGSDGSLYFAIKSLDADELQDSLEGARAMFLKPIEVGSRVIPIETAFGFDTQTDLPMDQRLSNALVAATAARESKASVLRYNPSMREAELSHIALFENVGIGLKKNQFVLAFQGQLSLNAGTVLSAEALVRWVHPTRGIVSPGEFMPVIEKSSLIHEFTIHVIELAIDALLSIKRVAPDFQLSINVPPILLSDDEFIDEAYNLIVNSALPNRAFILELTERGVLHDKLSGIAAMKRFVAAGIEFSIDDFGTANSNIELLRSVPATELKIDQSFVRGMISSQQDRSLVQSVIAMAHNLNFSVVAEGVETAQEQQILADMGCDKIQGFYHSKPLMLKDFMPYLSRSMMHTRRINARKYG